MRKLILTVILGCFVARAYAQSNLTLYNMEPIPQRLSVNPALAPDCKWYLGMPALSSLDFAFASNALQFKAINEAFVPVAGTDSFVVDITKLGDALGGKQTFISVGLNQEWLNFGFRIRKSMFTFGITEKVKTRVGIPNDFIKLAFQGNGGRNLGYDFNFNFGLDVLHTREFAVGYNRSLMDDRLRMGVRLKYVRGLNVINTAKNDIVFRTNPGGFEYKVTADIELNISSPLVLDSSDIDPVEFILGSPKNSGFGIDLGASFELNDRITLTASVIDLGVIKWKDNTRNIKSKNPGASFEYKGIDIKEYLGDSVKGGAGFEALSDTLLDIFALDTSETSFTTGLLGEFYIGGNFHINDKHNAGALFYGSFYNKQFYPALTLSWNSKFGRVLALSATYSIMRGSYTNIGLGMGLNLGPEQFYFASDNLIGIATGNVKTLGIRFGWNHTVGRKKWENEQKEIKENKDI
ncbi:MAG: hypothetical protein COA58_00920 [Bacteroidetes bacterium]|nr:MAG: hypothetical protein COA58_00920 [Bacteroidota bacterium]